MTTNKRKPRNVREREIMTYRCRQDRIFGIYLALKAWHNDLECIVLSRTDLLQFFDMDTTPTDRIQQFRLNIAPWFRGCQPYYRENDKTYVNFLFLVRGKDLSHLPQSPHLSDVKVIRKLIDDADHGFPKAALFLDLMKNHEFPSQGKIVAELAKLITGMTAPEVREQAEVTKLDIGNH